MSNHCATLNQFICECEMYILYDEKIKKEIFLMFPCATLTLGGGKTMFTFSVPFPEMKKENKCTQCKKWSLCHQKLTIEFQVNKSSVCKFPELFLPTVTFRIQVA